jgi:hypothetical protein
MRRDQLDVSTTSAQSMLLYPMSLSIIYIRHVDTYRVSYGQPRTWRACSLLSDRRLMIMISSTVSATTKKTIYYRAHAFERICSHVSIRHEGRAGPVAVRAEQSSLLRCCPCTGSALSICARYAYGVATRDDRTSLIAQKSSIIRWCTTASITGI